VWPRGFQEVYAPRFHDIGHVKVVRLLASYTSRLYPQECSWYSFSLGAESTPGPWCGRKEICHWKIQWPIVTVPVQNYMHKVVMIVFSIVNVHSQWAQNLYSLLLLASWKIKVYKAVILRWIIPIVFCYHNKTNICSGNTAYIHSCWKDSYMFQLLKIATIWLYTNIASLPPLM